MTSRTLGTSTLVSDVSFSPLLRRDSIDFRAFTHCVNVFVFRVPVPVVGISVTGIPNPMSWYWSSIRSPMQRIVLYHFATKKKMK